MSAVWNPMDPTALSFEACPWAPALAILQLGLVALWQSLQLRKPELVCPLLCFRCDRSAAESAY